MGNNSQVVHNNCPHNVVPQPPSPSCDIERPFRAQLCVYLAPGGSQSSVLMDTLRRIDGYGTQCHPFRLVEAEEVKLEVAMENDRITFKIFDQQVNGFGLTRLPHTATLNTVAHVLGAAARYYAYLGVTNENHSTHTNDVAVDFYLLTSERDYPELPFLLPTKPSLSRKDPSSGNSDVIDLVVDPDARYGIKITNNTPWDLYLNAFLFDTSNLSIAPYYTQSSAGGPEAPLQQNRTFAIGYGTAGASPLSYSLEENQDVNVSYLKIFFATWPIDMSDIVQTSPFSDENARDWTNDDARQARSSLLPLTQPLQPAHTWFTLDIPVVQRREMHAAV